MSKGVVAGKQGRVQQYHLFCAAGAGGMKGAVQDAAGKTGQCWSWKALGRSWGFNLGQAGDANGF